MDQESKIEHWKVIVIGAGIAGLTVASRLKKKGIQPLVLEANSEIGGRTITTKVGDRQIDLGATMIHGIGPGDVENVCKGRYNPIYEIALENELKTTKLYSAEDQCEDFYYDEEGHDMAHEFDFDEAYEQAQKFFAEQGQNANPHQSVVDYLDKFLQSFPNDERHFAYKVVQTLFHTYGGKLEDISMSLQDQDSLFLNSEAIFPLGGYGQVTSVLSKGLIIQTNSVVNKIQYSEEGAMVFCQNGKRYHADHVSITVSLGVLKSKLIEFVPELPAPKLQAIERIGFGNYHKIYLEFERDFVKKQADFIICANELVFMNIGKYTKVPELILFLNGDRATEWEQIDDTQARRRILETLQKIYGKIPKLKHFIRTKWGQNKFVQGGYSYPKKGQRWKHVKQLKKNIMNRLFFAGEATCFQFLGCTSAAALSGERVQAEISSLVEKQKPK